MEERKVRHINVIESFKGFQMARTNEFMPEDMGEYRQCEENSNELYKQLQEFFPKNEHFTKTLRNFYDERSNLITIAMDYSYKQGFSEALKILFHCIGSV
jgi:hypothetical protein